MRVEIQIPVDIFIQLNENGSHYVLWLIAQSMKSETRTDQEQGSTPRDAAPPARPLDSTALLGSRGEVEIIHQGETYRLRRTRQNKLILTK